MRWLLAVLALVLLAHAPSLPGALRGESFYGHDLENCDSHLGPPLDRAARDLTDGCDTLPSQRMAWDTLTRVQEAWQARHSTGGFLFREVWQATVEARALNLLDFFLAVWPARLLLPLGPALALLHLGPVLLATAAGFAYGRLAGASRLACVAGALVAGTSGAVIECCLRGQYPQALSLPTFLVYFAGIQRLRAGEAGGVRLTTGGLAASALLYWQNPLILLLGTTAWLAAGPWPDRRAWRRAAIAVGIAAVVCLPAAWPVLRALGAEEKVDLVAWGTPFPAGSEDTRQLADLVDEVPWTVALSPSLGWLLPALPLLPLAFAGRLPRWIAVWALAGLLILGPLPAVPEWLGTTDADTLGGVWRRENPVYTLVYQWVPSASRMRHPLRYGLLLAVALVALTVRGTDLWGEKRPRLAGWLVAAGAAWAVLVGPWPLRSSPLPADLLAAIAPCDEFLLAAPASGDRQRNAIHRLEALAWKPAYPVDESRAGGVGAPTGQQRARSAERVADLAAALRGDPGAVGAGTCVLYDPDWLPPEEQRLVHRRLPRAFGEVRASVALSPQTGKVEIYRR